MVLVLVWVNYNNPVSAKNKHPAIQNPFSYFKTFIEIFTAVKLEPYVSLHMLYTYIIKPFSLISVFHIYLLGQYVCKSEIQSVVVWVYLVILTVRLWTVSVI